MAIFQSDLSIKAAIELGMEDIRNNPWLIDDILGDAVQNPYLREKYGQKQIDACKEWFLNNQIDIYMSLRKDRDKLPCVTITLGSSDEKEEMKHMADQSTESVILLPNKIDKPIPYVMKPSAFTYTPSTGELVFPEDTPGLEGVAPGMIAVDPNTGTGFEIKEVTSSALVVEEDLDLSGVEKLGIVPQYQFYKARVEHTFFQETYEVGCHVHGDPQTLLWLHSIILYSLLRYREGLLEANGFSQSKVASTDMFPNEIYTGPGGEEAFSRNIILTGMVENTWIKSPRRYIEKINLREKVGDEYVGGVKILSNLDSPDFIDPTQEVWTTSDGQEDSD